MSRPAPESLIVKNLHKCIGSFSISAEFEAEPASRVVLTGPSGSGKTTLLRILTGLEPLNPSGNEGRIFLGQKELTSLPAEKREIGYVTQDPVLFASMNLLENAAFGLRVRGVGARERRAQVMPWLERVGLAARADESVDWLSGGEKQRVAFVRALVWKPQLILLDEPFSALDSELRDSLRQDLIGLHDEWPVPLVLVTHYEEDATIATQSLKIVEGPRPDVRIVRKSPLTLR